MRLAVSIQTSVLVLGKASLDFRAERLEEPQLGLSLDSAGMWVNCRATCALGSEHGPVQGQIGTTCELEREREEDGAECSDIHGRLSSLERRVKQMLVPGEVENLVQRLQAVEEVVYVKALTDPCEAEKMAHRLEVVDHVPELTHWRSDASEAFRRNRSLDWASAPDEGAETAISERLAGVEVRISALTGLSKKEREVSESLSASVDTLSRQVEAQQQEMEICRDTLRLLTGMPVSKDQAGLTSVLDFLSQRLEECGKDIARLSQSVAELGNQPLSKHSGSKAEDAACSAFEARQSRTASPRNSLRLSQQSSRQTSPKGSPQVSPQVRSRPESSLTSSSSTAQSVQMQQQPHARTVGVGVPHLPEESLRGEVSARPSNRHRSKSPRSSNIRSSPGDRVPWAPPGHATPRDLGSAIRRFPASPSRSR